MEDIYLQINEKLTQTMLEAIHHRTKFHLFRFLLKAIHKYPGLAHFMLVNRTSNHFYAPEINPLLGYSQTETSDGLFYTDKVKGAVWDAVYQAHTILVLGYNTLIWSNEKFIYFYHYWFEDSLDDPSFPQNFLKFSNPSTTKKFNIKKNAHLPLNHRWYQKNILSKCPDKICLEFYGVFLKQTNTHSVVEFSKRLLNDLYKILSNVHEREITLA